MGIGARIREGAKVLRGGSGDRLENAQNEGREKRGEREGPDRGNHREREEGGEGVAWRARSEAQARTHSSQ